MRKGEQGKTKSGEESGSGWEKGLGSEKGMATLPASACLERLGNEGREEQLKDDRLRRSTFFLPLWTVLGECGTT